MLKHERYTLKEEDKNTQCEIRDNEKVWCNDKM